MARQLADIDRLSPARPTFGVGVGGEDRREVSNCGVDPATRGSRMDECLTVLRQLLTGAAVTFHGAFIDVEEAMISPAPTPIPIVIGGRSDVAVRRVGRLGDGWLGVWNSPRQFAAAVGLAAEEAARTGRADPPARHAMQVWCGLAGSKEAARGCLAPAMQGYYQLPFERFERYCPYGTAEDVAEFLTPYVAAGCAEFNLIPQSPDPGQAIAGVAAVKKLWHGHDGASDHRASFLRPTGQRQRRDTCAGSSPTATADRRRSRCAPPPLTTPMTVERGSKPGNNNEISSDPHVPRTS